jgi:hypothetical protein
MEWNGEGQSGSGIGLPGLVFGRPSSPGCRDTWIWVGVVLNGGPLMDVDGGCA